MNSIASCLALWEELWPASKFTQAQAEVFVESFRNSDHNVVGQALRDLAASEEHRPTVSRVRDAMGSRQRESSKKDHGKGRWGDTPCPKPPEKNTSDKAERDCMVFVDGCVPADFDYAEGKILDQLDDGNLLSAACHRCLVKLRVKCFGDGVGLSRVTKEGEVVAMSATRSEVF